MSDQRGARDKSEEDAEKTPRSPARRRFLKRLALGGALFTTASSAYAYAVEPDDLQVAEVDVRIPGLPAEAEGLRVGQITDTHCDTKHACKRAAEAAKLLMRQKPDIVLLTGDYITSDPRGRMAGAAKALEAVSDAPRGAFAVLGNHDWWGGDPQYVVEQLIGIGCTVLQNRSVELPGTGGVWLVGLKQRCDNMQSPEHALRGVPADAVKLMMIHEPDYADEAPPGFALQFSGHSHGGQVRIPGLPPLHVPTHGRRYPEGLRQGPNHQVYTSRGVGMIGIKVRFCCPPEVAVIRLLKA
jgi:uncharacterized protein